jgi:hypothetical protein
MANEQNLIPFVPGQSGNLKGKPKGTKNRATLLKKWLGAKVTITDPNDPDKQRKVTVEDEVVLSIIQAAKNGSVKAQQLILDSVYGKVTEKVEHSGPDGESITAPIANAINSFEKSLLKIYGDESDDK